MVQAQGRQASEVDGARSGQDVGQDPVVSAAPSVSAAPGRRVKWLILRSTTGRYVR